MALPMTQDEPVWTPMYGDYQAGSELRNAYDLLRSIKERVLPALRHAVPNNADDPVDFDPERYHSSESVIATVTEGLLMAIASTFERAFRDWLADCAYHSSGSDEWDARLRRSRWEELKRHFNGIRAYEFSRIAGAADLDCLVLLCKRSDTGMGPRVQGCMLNTQAFFPPSTTGLPWKPPTGTSIGTRICSHEASWLRPTTSSD